ncbi:MAG: glycosyltransferase [bacterium]
MKEPSRYLLTGGGTGGHVYPALALAERIRQHEPDAQFLYLGAKGGAEERVVPPTGLPLLALRIRGLPEGRSPLLLAAVFVRLLWTCLQASRVLFRFRPHVILGTGGYASAPVLVAAFLLRSVRRWKGVLGLHEQNILPGRFNHWMSRHADFIGTSFPDTVSYLKGRRAHWTGYPVRREMERSPADSCAARDQTRADFGVPPTAKVVVIFGGSTGARTINRAVLEAMPDWIRREDLHIFHAVGYSHGTYDPSGEARMALSQIPATESIHQRYRWQPYFQDIQTYYRMADLVVCRSGAGSVWETAAVGNPALLIPKANLPGDHQVKNARFLERLGLARVLYERRDPFACKEGEKIEGTEFARSLLSMLDNPALLAAMRERARKLSIPQGSQRFYEVLEHARGFEEGPMQTTGKLLPADEIAGLQRVPMRIEWWSVHKLLLFLEEQWRRSAPLGEEDRRYVAYKADQLLAAPRWQERNAGVKLAGLIRYEERVPVLLRFITDRTRVPLLHRMLGGDFVQVGFIRRNAVQALWRIRRYDPEVRRALLTALTDPYFEVRSWAARAVGRLADMIGRDAEFEALLRRALKDRWFEVVASSLDALGRVATDPSILSDLEKRLENANGKVQHAALRCLMHLVERDVVRLSPQTQRSMNRIPMRGVEFSPQFPLRTTWDAFQKVLSHKNASSERHEEDIREFEKQEL